ncbi:MAG: hypothetical protein ABI878_08875 [Acidobacteriota bacterium]
MELFTANNASRVINVRAVLLTICFAVFTLNAAAQSRPPVIIIPGLIGSELVNSKTGERVWPKASRSKVDDLRLPISANIAANHDSLIPGDIIRSVKLSILPRQDVYEGLINALEAKGYKEGKWDAPGATGYENTIYVFPYDWRRDNVETARLLIRKIETLKRRLRKPNLKFDVIAHSMGGLIARYAAMYGNADLPLNGAQPKPTWAGARNFEHIILLGTPNEGSIISLQSLVNGVSLFGINVNLPFVQNLSKFDFFTIPSLFELLPTNGSLKIYGEDLKPIAVDVYDPKAWSTYDWTPMQDKKFEREFPASERRKADAYFAAVLSRAKRFQEALKASSKSVGTTIEIAGAECKDTPDGALIYSDKKKLDWKTTFKPEAVTTASGQKFTADELKKYLLAPGDSVVPKNSLIGMVMSAVGDTESILFPGTPFFECEEHNKLPANAAVQNYILKTLSVG